MNAISNPLTGNFNNDPEDDFSFSVHGSGDDVVGLGIGKNVSNGFSVQAAPRKIEQPRHEESANPPTQPELHEAVVDSPESSQLAESNQEPDSSEILEAGFLSNFDSPTSDHVGLELEVSLSPIDETPDELGQGLLDRIKQVQDRRDEILTDLMNLPNLVPSLQIHEDPQGSFAVVEEVQIDQAPMFGSLEELELQYKEKTTQVKLADKTTAADRAGKAVNWWTQTFIVKPVSWIFRTIHNAVANMLSALMKGLLYFALSIIAIVVGITLVSVIGGHFAGVPPYDWAMQEYDLVKRIIIQLHRDFRDAR